MIRGDWKVAQAALQIIAEQGPGLAHARQESIEDAAMAGSLEALGG